MPTLFVVQNNFTVGEMTPIADSRHDSENSKYHAAVGRLENFTPLVHGPLRKRFGTRFIARIKDMSQRATLLPFIFGVHDSYVIEAGNGYFRFYRNRAALDAVHDISTPYTSAQAEEIKSAQDRDIRWLAHGTFPLHELRRSSATGFSLVLAGIDPVPSLEQNTPRWGPAAIVPLGGGQSRFDSVLPDFTPADVGREIVDLKGRGRASIIQYIGPVQVYVSVLEGFERTNFNYGEWATTKSPNARLAVEKPGPVGQTVRLWLTGDNPQNPQLIRNTSGELGMTYWTDFSRPVIAAGTHDGATQTTILVDLQGQFLTLGIEPGHQVYNLTGGSNGRVVSVPSQTDVHIDALQGGRNDFQNTDAYNIRSTGAATVAIGGFRLTGGERGMAWIEQVIATAPQTWYKLTFSVHDGPVSCQVGSVSRASDVFGETSYGIGNSHEIIFLATSYGTYIQFRNNQFNPGVVGQINCRDYSLGGWHGNGYPSGDVGKYIYTRGGIIIVTRVDTMVNAWGVVLSALDLQGAETDDKPFFTLAGAWTLQAPMWGGGSGYPRAIALHQQRLFAAGSDGHPMVILGSAAGDFHYFGIGRDDDGIHRTLASHESNAVHWLLSANTLVAGTSHAEFSVTGGTNSMLSDKSFFASDPSSSGSKPIQPIRTKEGLVLFVDRSGRRLLVLSFDIRVDRLAAEDLTELSEHITESGIRDMSYNQTQDMVWVLLENDTLIALTFKSKQSVFAWARVPTEGAVEALTTIVTPERDETYIIARRSVNGQTVRYLEVIDETQGFWGAATTDCSTTYEGPPTDTIACDHLEGEEVVAICDGIFFEGLKVQDGVIRLPIHFSRGEVGLRLRSLVTLLKPTLKGQPDAINAATQVSLGTIYVKMSDTCDLKISQDGQTIDDESSYRTGGGNFDTPAPLFSGVETFKVMGLEGAESDGSVSIIHDSASPCLIKEIVRTVYVSEPAQ